jgi:hypothetical protein
LEALYTQAVDGELMMLIGGAHLLSDSLLSSQVRKWRKEKVKMSVYYNDDDDDGEICNTHGRDEKCIGR